MVMIRRGVVEVMLRQHSRVLGLFEKLWNRVLEQMSKGIPRFAGWGALTLDISLKTEVCASLNSDTTSCKLVDIASSSPTARVIRAARLFRKL